MEYNASGKTRYNLAKKQWVNRPKNTTPVKLPGRESLWAVGFFESPLEMRFRHFDLKINRLVALEVEIEDEEDSPLASQLGYNAILNAETEDRYGEDALVSKPRL